MREGEFNVKRLEYIRGIYALISPDVRRYCVGGSDLLEKKKKSPKPTLR